MVVLVFVLFLWSFQAGAADAFQDRSEFLSGHSASSLHYTLAQNNFQKGRRRRALMLQQAQLNRALDFIKKGNYLEGVKKLFLLSQKPSLKKRRAEIRFVLGKTFMKLKLFHAAAFQFISVIETGNRRYVRRSLKNLSFIAGLTGDRKILRFAIEKGGIKNLRGQYRDSLYYQYGKYKLKDRNYRQAVFYLKKISRQSSLYGKARYHLGLAYAEMNQISRAVSAFDDILSQTSYSTDPLRVSAIMGKARVYYQAKKWDLSTYFYRQVPKDSPFWHDMLTENSWALLRAGKFRSALNGFHTLHSSYYKDRYQPESFLLRAIIYMYICKYTEMERVIYLFNVFYDPVRRWVNNYLRSGSPNRYYSDVLYAVNTRSSSFPKAIALRIFRENDFRMLNKYFKHLKKEKGIILSFPGSWRRSKAGRYSLKLVNTRIKSSKKQLENTVRRHLRAVQSEMKEFFNQEQYLKYESLRGRRKQIKKKISKKYLGNIKVIERASRDYFVQNGFEFWTFNGEYWLDELGNYHYVGLQSCQ